MPRIPQSFIDSLLERADIVDVIGRRVALKRAGTEFTARCPFHDEKTPSFTVAPNKQFYHCFGCGAHGTTLGFLMEYDRLEFRDAIEVLAGEFGLEIPAEAESASEDGPPRQPLFDALAAADRHYRKNLREHPPAIDYLKQRGISGATAKRYGLGYAAASGQDLATQLPDTAAAAQAGLVIERDGGRGVFDRFRNRLMFPIRDTRGRSVALGGRTLGEDRAKYLNSPETPVFHKSNQLYGLYEARQANRRLPRLLVVEGYMDVVALAEHGFDNAVATLGTATTEAHTRLLFRYTDEVVFCFDGDTAGQNAAVKALDQSLAVLRGTRCVRFLFLPAGEDPDSLVAADNGPERFQQYIDAAPNASSLLIERLTKDIDLDSIDGRVQLIERARTTVNALPADTFRTELVAEIARLSGYTEEDLRARFTQPASQDHGSSGSATDTPEPHAIETSAVTKALTRLLADPELATTIAEPERLRSADTRGAEILVEAIEFFAREPSVSIAQWLERYRDQRYFDRLQLLAAENPPGSRTARAKEFSASIHRLMPQSESEYELRTRYRELLAQQANHPLDSDAAAELRDIGHRLASAR